MPRASGPASRLSDRLLGCSSARPASSVSGVNRGQVFKEGSFKGGDHAKNEDSKRQESREHRTTPFWGISPKTTLLLSLTSIDSRLSLRPHPFRIAHRCPTLLLHVVLFALSAWPIPLPRRSPTHAQPVPLPACRYQQQGLPLCGSAGEHSRYFLVRSQKPGTSTSAYACGCADDQEIRSPARDRRRVFGVLPGRGDRLRQRLLPANRPGGVLHAGTHRMPAAILRDATTSTLVHTLR